MDSLIPILRTALEGYTGEGANGTSPLTVNSDKSIYTVVTVGMWDEKPFTLVDIVARIVANHIVIDCDLNSDPLVDALMQAGVPRDHIILAYAGEPAPEFA
jgi:hypothetical protein